MKTIIEDTWFPAGAKIRIGLGTDELLFVRCTFEGGDIFVEPTVGDTVFSNCLFRGTKFSGQSLSERISIHCRSAASGTEEATAASGARADKFRR
jgi:hypothetical protein